MKLFGIQFKRGSRESLPTSSIAGSAGAVQSKEMSEAAAAWVRGEDLEGRDIFVLAADGSAETLLVNAGYNATLGWSADGKRVLFLKDRNGNLDIWSAPVEGNRPQGAASRVLANNGNMAPVGLTASGSLYYAVGAQRDQQIRVAKMDFNAASLGPAGAATPGSAPQWSPDGQYVAFLAPQPRLRRS
jgi:Tol biopolymer transport system component